MILEKICKFSVRVEPDGNVLLLFVCLGSGGDPERDANGDPYCYGVKLEQDDAAVAAQVRRLARWLTDMAARDIQAEMDAVNRATASAALLPADPQPEGGRQAPPDAPPTTSA